MQVCILFIPLKGLESPNLHLTWNAKTPIWACGNTFMWYPWKIWLCVLSPSETFWSESGAWSLCTEFRMHYREGHQKRDCGRKPACAGQAELPHCCAVLQPPAFRAKAGLYPCLNRKNSNKTSYIAVNLQDCIIITAKNLIIGMYDVNSIYEYL